MSRPGRKLPASLLFVLASLAVPAGAAPGDSDPAFAGGGAAILDFTYSQAVDIRAAAAWETDVYVVGTIPRPASQGGGRQLVTGRINWYGQPDPFFGTGGWAPLQGIYEDCEPVGLAVNPTSGELHIPCIAGTQLLMVNAFGESASYRSEELAYAYPMGFTIRAVAVEPDGKVLVAGSYTESDGRRLLVHRYDRYGYPDLGFGAYGRASFGIPGRDLEAHAVTSGTLNTSRIYVAGSASTAASGTDMMVVSFTGAGALDATFGQSGMATADHQGGDDVAFTVATDGDRIWAAGRAGAPGSARSFVWGLTPAGVDDTGFADTGRKVFDLPLAAPGDTESWVTSIAPKNLGTTTLLGPVRRLATGDLDFGFTWLHYSGHHNTSYGNCDGGVCGKYILVHPGNDVPLQFGAQTGGVFVAVGRPESAGETVVVSRQFDFGPDTSYGVDGRATFAVRISPLTILLNVALQPDGRIVAAGDVEDEGRLARFNADGTLDASFGTGGTVRLPGTTLFDAGLAVQPDGRITVVGGSYPPLAWRLLPDGTFDPSWNGGNAVFLPLANNARDAAVQPDGKLVATLIRAPNIVVARRNPDGSPDTAFGSGGEVEVALRPGTSDEDSVVVKVLPDGRLFVGGGTRLLPATWDNVKYTMTLLRFLPSGAPDPTWGVNGVATANNDDLAYAHDLVVRADGKVVASGRCRHNGPRTCVVRFNADGSVDTTFGSGGFLELSNMGHDGIAVALDAEGRVVVVGEELGVAAHVSRLLPNDMLDTTFGSSGQVSLWGARGASGLQQPDGRIVVGTGEGWTWRIARLLGGGPMDTTPPETSLSMSPTTSPTSQATATATFSADEAGSTFACSLDGGAYAACTSPHNITGLADGAHTISVRATDPAGNVDPTPATHSWTVDTVAPDTSLSGAPSGTVTTREASITFTSNEAGTFECRLDAAPFAACTSPATYSGLADGAHTFEVRAKDAAGNVDATPATAAWTVDATAPDTQLTVTPAASPTNATSFTATFTSEAGATFECRLDAEVFAACTSPVTRGGLADGTHTFEVRARDAAGNVDATPASRTWTVDTQAPDTSISSGPSGTVTSNAANFAVTATESPVTFECRLDGGAWTACAGGASYSGLADGTHTFEARAADATGNVDATPAARTWTVDTTAPDTSITSAPSGTVASNSATITFTSSDPGATFECSLDGAAFGGCASPVTLTGLADGAHAFQVRARDAVGNTDAPPAAASWTVDTVAPESTITGAPAAATNQTSATFTFTSSEAGTFECRLDGGAFAPCTSPKAYSGLAVGSHTFEVRAIDAVGNMDASPASHTWTIDTTAPNTSITSGPSGNNNPNTATFSFTSTEPNSTFQCQLDSGAYVGCTSPTTYSGLAKGSHTFRVRAIDAAGNVDASPATRSWSVK